MTRIAISILSLVAAWTASATSLPPPDGQYGTASSQVLLVDHSRKDPYAAASANSHSRQVMVSSFYPVALSKDCTEYTSSYMPNTTAAFYDQQLGSLGIPSNTFGSLELVFCSSKNCGGVDKQAFPVILFSPGLGNSRLIYSAMAQSLASKGNIVITIDHPYDAEIVEFPDGSTVLAANITTDDQIEAATNVRVQDISFVLDQLQSRRSAAKLLGGHARGNSKQYAIYGHSLGGAAAAEAALSDSRLTSAVNLDGTFFGSVVSRGANKPLLIVAHDGKNLTTDPSWTSTWNATKQTTKVAIALPDTAHGSYTDYPLIVDALGIPEDVRSQFAALIGTIPGKRVQDVVSTVVSHFFDYSRCKKKTPLPKLEGSKLKDVQLLGKSEKSRCR